MELNFIVARDSAATVYSRQPIRPMELIRQLSRSLHAGAHPRAVTLIRGALLFSGLARGCES